MRTQTTMLLQIFFIFSLNPCAAGGEFGKYKIMQKSLKMAETLAHGYHLRVLSESFPINTNKMGFRWFSRIFASLCFGGQKP